MTSRLKMLAAGAAVAALVAPQLALAQAAPKLREVPGSGFPDRSYTLQLPERRALSAAQLEVTENGGLVSGLSVEAPGTNTGAILLIDASNSMRGAPIAGAMAAARAFMAQRAAALPVAVIAYNPEITVLTEFTTDKDELAASVAKAPATSEGTHIYDALIRAAELVEDEGLPRATAVLLSDGHRRGVQATRAEALDALSAANVRVISVGLRSPQYDPETLRAMSQQTRGKYLESATPAALEPIFAGISAELSNEYLVTYRSLLPPNIPANLSVSVTGLPTATAKYTTPALDLTARGTFDRSFVDDTILSPWLMIFVIVAVLALIAFAILTALDVRNRSIKRRMALYVSVPSEEEGNVRRAEVATMLAEQAQRRFGGTRWWQNFERDVELSGLGSSPYAIAGWTLIAGIVTSLGFALAFQSLAGLLVGLVAPLIVRFYVSLRVRGQRAAFAEQLPDNLDVLAGALRAGHSLVGALSVMMEGAAEPSKREFRRVLQDEQLGVPIDQALMVMRHRMENIEIEQLAIVTRLQREAGGNTAEVLDRVAENIRAKMEIRRLIRVLTAQGRLAMWILMGMPIAMVGFISLLNPAHLEPLFQTTFGHISLGAWFVAMILGYVVIRKIVDIEL